MIRKFYDSIAPRYDRWIAPAVTPLIADLIATSPTPLADRRVLEIGAGTGIGVALLIEQRAHAIGIDLSAGMLHAGQLRHCVQANLLHAPFAPASFDLMLSAFGLNNTYPAAAFKTIRPLLRPGGWLIGQEWAAQDPIAAAFDMAVDQLNLIISDPRVDLPDHWSDVMQDAEDYRDRLQDAGFSVINVEERAPVIVRLPLKAFIGYRLAWLTDPTGVQIAQITPYVRSFADQEGMITWQPSLFRFYAKRA